MRETSNGIKEGKEKDLDEEKMKMKSFNSVPFLLNSYSSSFRY